MIRWRRNCRIAVLGGVAALAATACGGTSKSSANPYTTPSIGHSTSGAGAATTTTAPSLPAGSPPIVGGKRDLGGLPVANTLQLPLVYMAAGRRPVVPDGLGTSNSDAAVSPDVTMVAIPHAQTAVKAASIDIVDLKTASVRETVEAKAGDISGLDWSPDSTAIDFSAGGDIYLHRIGGATASLPSQSAYSRAAGSLASGFSSDGTNVALVVTERGIITIGAGGATVLPNTALSGNEAGAQLSNADGQPVTVGYVVTKKRNQYGLIVNASITPARFTPTGKAVAIKTPAGPSLSWTMLPGISPSCGRLEYMRVPNSSSTQAYLYDPETDAVVPLDPAELSGDLPCPLLSPDGKLAAARASDGVAVIDMSSGKSVNVAKIGAPVAWNADSTKVLVQGNGTFIVAADGSGGGDAAVQASQAAYPMCAVGDTGKVIVDSGSGVSLLDLATNKARRLGVGQLGASCSVQGSGNRWVISGGYVIDVRDAKVVQLIPPKVDSNDFLGIGAYLWYGEQHRFASYSTSHKGLG